MRRLQGESGTLFSYFPTPTSCVTHDGSFLLMLWSGTIQFGRVFGGCQWFKSVMQFIGVGKVSNVIIGLRLLPSTRILSSSCEYRNAQFQTPFAIDK